MLTALIVTPLLVIAGALWLLVSPKALKWTLDPTEAAAAFDDDTPWLQFPALVPPGVDSRAPRRVRRRLVLVS